MHFHPSMFIIYELAHKHYRHNTAAELQVTSNFWTPKMALDFFAGCMGGVAGVLVGHPLDTVKVHLQTDNPKNKKYHGTFHCFRTILATDSVRGLYRGISSPMSGIGFVNAIVFGIYGNVQRLTDDPTSLESHFLAGSVAGFLQSSVCSPMELAKTRMQLQSESGIGRMYKGPIDCLRYIYQTHGPRGVFKGLGLTACRDIPGFSSYFVSYEYMMSIPESPGVLYNLTAGGLAGIFSWLACYPVDVLKTCMQADGFGEKAKFKGVLDCSMKGFRSEGWYFFFRGLNSTLIRAFPMNAACFFVVSSILRIANPKGVDMVVNTTNELSIVNLDNAPEQRTFLTNTPPDDKFVRNSILQSSIPKLIYSNNVDTALSNEEKSNDLHLKENVYYVFEDEEWSRNLETVRKNHVESLINN